MIVYSIIRKLKKSFTIEKSLIIIGQSLVTKLFFMLLIHISNFVSIKYYLLYNL